MTEDATYQAQKPFYCAICDTGFLSHVRLVDHNCPDDTDTEQP